MTEIKIDFLPNKDLTLHVFRVLLQAKRLGTPLSQVMISFKICHKAKYEKVGQARLDFRQRVQDTLDKLVQKGYLNKKVDKKIDWYELKDIPERYYYET